MHSRPTPVLCTFQKKKKKKDSDLLPSLDPRSLNNLQAFRSDLRRVCTNKLCKLLSHSAAPTRSHHHPPEGPLPGLLWLGLRTKHLSYLSGSTNKVKAGRGRKQAGCFTLILPSAGQIYASTPWRGGMLLSSTSMGSELHRG